MVSDCCSAESRPLSFESGIDYEEMGICPECKEHCSYINEEEES